MKFMKKSIIWGLLVTIFLAYRADAQDIHWTLFDMSPLMLNPAKTGDFHGTARVGGSFRTQYGSVADNSFNTMSYYADAPIIRGFRSKDWIGVGFVYAGDKAGTLEQALTATLFSAAYHYSLNDDKRKKSTLTFGVRYGSYGLKYNARQAALWGGDPETNKLGTDKSATEIAAGIHLNSKVSKRATVRAGLSYGHLTNPKIGVIRQDYKLPSRLTVHGELDYLLKPRLMIQGLLLAESFGKTSSNTVAQAKARFLINPHKRIDINTGLGYRFGDALQVLMGAQFKDIKVGLGYDLTMSTRSSDRLPLGGLEISAGYIVKIYKEPKSDPIIFCPRF